MQFLQEKLVIEKVNRQEIKKRLFTQRKNFDQLYIKAQEFIQTSDDPEKVQELLELLDDDQKAELMTQYQNKTATTGYEKKSQ